MKESIIDESKAIKSPPLSPSLSTHILCDSPLIISHVTSLHFTTQAARRDVKPSLAKKLHVLAALEVRPLLFYFCAIFIRENWTDSANTLCQFFCLCYNERCLTVKGIRTYCNFEKKLLYKEGCFRRIRYLFLAICNTNVASTIAAD